MSDHNIKSDFNEWVGVLAGAAARPEQLVEEVFLDAALQLYGGIAVDTPVDTGFLRAGLSASTAGVDPVKQGDRPATAKPGQFTSVNDGLGAIAQAAKEKTPLDIGFQAEYAPYVEDEAHMMKMNVARWPELLNTAVKNAGGA